eukprot:evm.model.scf_966.6 EVM.evm.TU.scf_966.6   scf_966:37318-42868(-)
MSDAELIEQLRAKVVALRSPRGASRGHREGTDSCSTTSKDSSKLNSGHGHGLARTPSQEADAAMVVNVGGVKYTTTVATLKAVESSYFSLMLNGLWEPARTRGGDIFVDRNGELFGYILEHLRGQCHREPDTFQLPDDLDTLKALLREAEFYRLPALVSRLNKRKEEMMDAKDRSDTETDIHTGHESIDPLPRVELDIAYSAISSPHCQFTEEGLRDLTMRVNYQILQKGQDGFRVRDVSSRVHLNPNDPMMPYSMTCTAVLVREKNLMESNGRTAASAAHRVRGQSPGPLILHHPQPQLAVGRRPSPVHSPRPELGRYRLEASALVHPADDRLWCHQVATSPPPEPVSDPLQQVTEARLRLQALVAEHASKGSQASTRGPADDHAASRRSSGAVVDHSLNPPVGAMDAPAVPSPLVLRSREHSSINEPTNQSSSPLAGLEQDPMIGVYSGEVRRIMGIPQAPGCQSNPPLLTDATEVHGPLESLHASESTDMDRDMAMLGGCTAEERIVQEAGVQGEVPVAENDVCTGLASHACEDIVCGDGPESVSSCSESGPDQGSAPETMAIGEAACQMDAGEPVCPESGCDQDSAPQVKAVGEIACKIDAGGLVCSESGGDQHIAPEAIVVGGMAGLIDAGESVVHAAPAGQADSAGPESPIRSDGVHEPPATTIADFSYNAGELEEVLHDSQPSLHVGALQPPVCEQPLDDRASVQQSDNNESTEADSGVASDGQNSGQCSGGIDDSLLNASMGLTTGACIECEGNDVKAIGRVDANEAFCSAGAEKLDDTVKLGDIAGEPVDGRQDATDALQNGPSDVDCAGENGAVDSYVDDAVENREITTEVPTGTTEGAEDVPQTVACWDGTGARDSGHDVNNSEWQLQREEPDLVGEAIIHQPPTPDREARKRQVQARDVDAPGDAPADVSSPQFSGAPPEGDPGALGLPNAHPAEEKAGSQGSSGVDGRPGAVPGSYASASSDPTSLGDFPKGSLAPPMRANASIAKIPGPSRGLPPPSKFSRYQSARQEGAVSGDQPGAGPRPAPLFAVPHRSATSPPLLQDRIASSAKARSRIPNLNLAPMTAAAGRERAHMVGRRPVLGEEQGQGVAKGGLQKGPGAPAKRSGLVRPGAAASGLTRHAPGTAAQRLGVRGHRPSGSQTTGQR